MKKLTILLVAVLMFSFAVADIYAKVSDDNKKKSSVTEANVWTTEDGAKHYKCPVMGGEGVVDSKTISSVVDGKRYYYCCAGCVKKFEAEPAKYLKNFAMPGNVVKIDKEGQHFKCPVTGEAGVASEKTAYSDFNGKRYYFCCSNCKTKFETKPQKYLQSDKKEKCSNNKKCCSKLGNI